MEYETDKKAALSKMAAFCSRKECCRWDVEKKLRTMGVGPNDVDDIVYYLQEQGYLNDERFARFFVRDKFRFNHWGRIRLRYELQQRQIGQPVIELAFEEIAEADYRATAARLLTQKLRGQKATEDVMALKAKLLRFGQGRGFEPELLYALMDELIKP